MTEPIDVHGLHLAISELAEVVKGWDVGNLPANMTCLEVSVLADVLARARETEAAGLLIYYHGFGDRDEEDDHHDVYAASQTESGVLPIEGEALRLAYEHVAALADKDRG